MTLDPRRARVFGEVADLYDRFRPSYPAAMVDDIVAGVDRPVGRVLDVGCGTGKAAVLFAARGLRVTGVEPDPAMAALARRNLAPYPACTVLDMAFEQWSPGDTRFDLVTCGQAWHWLDDSRGARAQAALRHGGLLALFWNTARRDACGLRDELDAVYAEHAPTLQRSSVLLGCSVRTSDDARHMEQLHDDFDRVVSRDYDWSVRYSTEQYVGLMQTHSDHRLLDPVALDRLVAAVTSVVDTAGGSLEYAYRSTLFTGRRRG